MQVRMQSGTSGTVLIRHQSCLKSFRQIYSEEGLRGLYRVSTTPALLVYISGGGGGGGGVPNTFSGCQKAITKKIII